MGYRTVYNKGYKSGYSPLAAKKPLPLPDTVTSLAFWLTGRPPYVFADLGGTTSATIGGKVLLENSPTSGKPQASQASSLFQPTLRATGLEFGSGPSGLMTFTAIDLASDFTIYMSGIIFDSSSNWAPFANTADGMSKTGMMRLGLVPNALFLQVLGGSQKQFNNLFPATSGTFLVKVSRSSTTLSATCTGHATPVTLTSSSETFRVNSTGSMSAGFQNNSIGNRYWNRIIYTKAIVDGSADDIVVKNYILQQDGVTI